MNATAIVLRPGVSLGDGRYRLERRLGAGGMASVWLARDAVLDRHVAVKVLSDALAGDPEYLARFRREARVAASLWHPNLVDVFDFDAGGEERPFLVMEYVDGASLAERLDAGEEIDAGRLAHELLSALAYIHDGGVLHRDVKPANVLIGTDGRARLTDFGIAQPHDATSLTQTGNVLGTARYIAPEVMNGEPASERSDLYACGVVVGQLGDGARSESLAALTRRLRSSDPARRPDSAQQALAELRGDDAEPDAGKDSTVSRPLPGAPAAGPAPPEIESAEPAGRLPAGAREPARTDGASRPPGPARTPGPTARRLLPLLAVAAVAALVVGVVAGGGTGSPPGEGDGGGAGGNPRVEGQSAPGASASVPQPQGSDPEGAVTLNDQGFRLIQDGEYEQAIPVLSRAVRSSSADADDLTYAYALFNLGNALRLAGRPEQAIPVLKERLEIPNQTEVVRDELAAARAAAR